MSIYTSTKRILFTLTVVVTVPLVGRDLVAGWARASSDTPMSSAEYQEARVIGSGIAQAIVQPGASLVTFASSNYTASNNAYLLSSYTSRDSALRQFVRQISVSAVLYGSANPGEALISYAHFRHLNLQSLIPHDLVLQELNLGRSSPFVGSSEPLYLGVLYPLSSKRIGYAPAQAEYEELSNAGVLRSIDAYEPMNGWMVFPMTAPGTSSQQTTLETTSSPRLPAELLSDLETICNSYLPPPASHMGVTEHLAAISVSAFRGTRGNLMTEVGKIILDELEGLSSTRIIPENSSFIRQWEVGSGLSSLSREELPADEVSQWFDGNFSSHWGVPNQYGTYELEFNLGATQSLSRIALDWTLDSAHAPVDILLSDDGGKTYHLVDKSLVNESNEARTVVLFNSAFADHVKLRYNQPLLREDRIWASISEVDIRAR